MGLITFGVEPFKAQPEGVPVDIISDKQFSEVTAGSKTAPKPAEKPKPLVEKIAATKKVVEDPAPKVSEKKEVKAAKAEQPPAPVPEPRPKSPKPAASKPKVDPIAEALKKDAAKKQREAREEQRVADQKQAKKREQPRFDPAKVAALLDKREAQRHAATGNQLNPTASLGLAHASASRLSQSEIDALRARLARLWNPPVGAKDPEEIVVRVRVQLTRDGRVMGAPQVLTSGHSVLFQTARESAVRALFLGQPFDMLRPETYEQWKDIEITFDPRELMRG